jgi:flavin reductase (DIM6/NTAB) family NADH-FMN oxidoreductase RutF
MNRALDLLDLRRALGAFVTGVTVVTTVDAEGRPRGMTANSFTSVSLDPPLVLVCIASTAASFAAFSDFPSFAVNILAEGQEELANRFASKRPDKFSGVDWSVATTGAPVLGETLAWLDCSVHHQINAGDHLIVIGRVEGMSCGTARPLAYCQGNYVTFGLVEDTVNKHLTKRLLVGWIVESEGRILLSRVDNSRSPLRWSIPMSPLRRELRNSDALHVAVTESLGVGVDISFLYSAIDLPDQEALCLIYRGEAHADPVARAGHATVEAFEPSAIPWAGISDRHIRNMLRRYLQERVSDRFGIYLGSVADGRVAMVGPHRPWTVHARALTDIEPAGPQPLAYAPTERKG